MRGMTGAVGVDTGVVCVVVYFTMGMFVWTFQRCLCAVLCVNVSQGRLGSCARSNVAQNANLKLVSCLPDSGRSETQLIIETPALPPVLPETRSGGIRKDPPGFQKDRLHGDMLSDVRSRAS